MQWTGHTAFDDPTSPPDAPPRESIEIRTISFIPDCVSIPRTSLEQWAVLAAVIDHGGFAQAATALNKSQSAISYAIARLQESLDVPVLVIEGRKAVLTPHGQALLKRARIAAEGCGHARAPRPQPEARLGAAAQARGGCRVSPRAAAEDRRGAAAALSRTRRCSFRTPCFPARKRRSREGTADVVVTTRVPPGFLGEPLLDVTFIAVAHPDHALFKLDVPLDTGHLVHHVQAVVRDSGVKHPRDEGWLGAERRCTVSSVEASLATVQAGLAYAWLPEHLLEEPLEARHIQGAAAGSGATRVAVLCIWWWCGPELAGPAVRAAVECFQRHMPPRARLIQPEAGR